MYLLVHKSNQIGCSSGAITHHHWNRWLIRYILQDSPYRICATLNHQTNNWCSRMSNYLDRKEEVKILN